MTKQTGHANDKMSEVWAIWNDLTDEDRARWVAYAFELMSKSCQKPEKGHRYDTHRI